jgi:hypothetical protein
MEARNVPDDTAAQEIGGYLSRLTHDQVGHLSGLQDRLALLVEGGQGDWLPPGEGPEDELDLLEVLDQAGCVVFSLNSSPLRCDRPVARQHGDPGPEDSLRHQGGRPEARPAGAGGGRRVLRPRGRPDRRRDAAVLAVARRGAEVARGSDVGAAAKAVGSPAAGEAIVARPSRQE